MPAKKIRQAATQPEDLGRLFLQCANDGDVEGLVALYEPDAVLAFPSGEVTRGHAAIRAVYKKLLAEKPVFAGEPRPALRNGDIALTSTLLPNGGATAEIARRQPNGTWLWLVDQPSVLS